MWTLLFEQQRRLERAGLSVRNAAALPCEVGLELGVLGGKKKQEKLLRWRPSRAKLPKI